jgi:iron complex outermembrane receptor protein
MKFQRKGVALALACALGAGGAFTVLFPSGTQAQVKIEPIEVTGSRIKRTDAETALPVQVFTRETLERENINSAAEFMDRLSVNSTTGGSTMTASIGGTAAGLTLASLRGLGSQRTLVLLDGRRAAVNASSGSGGAVDLNTIPLAAIERIEVLTDGASAVYGSDAVAGVINFILRKDYQGAEAAVYYGSPEHTGGWTQRYTGTAGFGDLATQKFNVLVTADYQKLGAIRALDRPFSYSAYRPDLGLDKTSGNTIPANVGTPVGTRNPGNPVCLPPFSFPTTASPLQCRFDYASVIDILPPQELWNIVGKATWQITPDHQAFFEGLYADSKVTGRSSPSPISQATFLSGEPVLLQPSSPFYPHTFAQQFGIDGKPLNIAWRSLDLGPRTEVDESKQSRLVAGMQGVAWGWDYNGAATYNENKFIAKWTGGWLQGSIAQPIFNSGQIDFFHRLTPEMIALLQPALIREDILDGKTTTTTLDLHASNEIWQLPAGPLAVAVGGEFRRETFETQSPDVINAGDVPGFGSAIPDLAQVSRQVYALFAEVNIPIVKTLEGNVAVRYDHYSDFGSTTNPKGSLRWQPTKELLFRGSWGTGFRAATLVELFNPINFSSTGSNHDDPVRCPVTHSSLDCQTQFNSELGGNPALKPERSTQYGAGGVWEPVAGNSIGLDFWHVEVKDVVGQLGEDTIFNNFDRSVGQGLIVRFPVDPETPNLPGRINFIVQTNQNIQKLRVEGLDVDLNLRFPKLDWGQFRAALHGTYLIKWEQANPDTGQLENFAGQSSGGIATVQAGVGFPGSLPRWKHNASLYYDYGPWAATITQLYQNSYKDDTTSGIDRTVGSYSLYDISGTYKGFKNLALSLGIKNLLDTNPPASVQGQAFQVGYDPTYADPRGRLYWAGVKYTFR